jgi:hypothetical protein
MEAVQQKVALFQQLEEWEVDLQVMLQEQVKDKLIPVGKQSDSDGKMYRVNRKLSRHICDSIGCEK